MDRRRLLQTAASSVYALAVGQALAAMAQPAQSEASVGPLWRSDPFTLGVASGEPRPDSVLLWTRLYPGPARPGASATHEEQTTHFQEKCGLGAFSTCEVSYEIYEDEGLRKRIQMGVQTTHAGRGWSVHARVYGLQSARTYWYRFKSGNVTSPVGRTRTAPAPDVAVSSLRLALASCQHYEQGNFTAHAHMAKQELDMVLFVGDYIYESTNPKYRVRPHSGGVPYTLAEYRERHALYKLDADLRDSHAAHPWICTWDDHEVDNDYASDQSAKYLDPVQFLARRAAAYQAYFEHMPVMPWGNDNSIGTVQRIHRHWSWGRLADLWTLDCRQYRTPQPCRDPLKGGGRVVLNCTETDDSKRTMLGMQQEQWLTQGLASSRRQWRLLGQSTQVSSTGIDTPLGRTAYTDGWDGYSAARTRLLQAVSDMGQTNVVTLGGDVHQNVAANLRLRANDLASPVVASEFVSTSVTTRGMGKVALGRILASNPDIVHARSDERGYTRLDVTPQSVLATFLTTSFPARSGASLGVQAVGVVDAGRAGVRMC